MFWFGGFLEENGSRLRKKNSELFHKNMFHKTNFVSKPIFSPALYDISDYISYINR